MPMTEAAIHSGLTGDLYVSMAEPVSDSEWGIKIQFKPFVSWIWAGCALMALGGMLAASDRRYRVRKSNNADEDSSDIHEEKVAS